MRSTPALLLALALLGAPPAAASAQAATFLDLRWDFSDQQAAAYLASLGYVGARGPTAPPGIPVGIRVFTRAGNPSQGRHLVNYHVRDGRITTVHYALRAPAAAVEAARRSLVAELDGRFGPSQAHPFVPGLVVWNTGSNRVTLRTEAVQGEAVLHVYYYAPGSREGP